MIARKLIHAKNVAGGNYPGGEPIGEGAGALAQQHKEVLHQPNSLDDLDGETLPFDDVPIRYDASGKHILVAKSLSNSHFNIKLAFQQTSSYLIGQIRRKLIRTSISEGSERDEEVLPLPKPP